MKLFKKLAELANKLDQIGYPKEAGEIDEMLKEAGLWDTITGWFGGKQIDVKKIKDSNECTCGQDCSSCTIAKHYCDLQNVPKAIRYGKQCIDTSCDLSNALKNPQSQQPQEVSWQSACTCGGYCVSCEGAKATGGASLMRIEGDTYRKCDPNCPVVQQYGDGGDNSGTRIA